MMKPPISRMGGKRILRKTIIEMIPPHTCYIEPFFGAGWVYFGKEKSKVEVINDVDSELVNLFKMMKHHSEEIERTLKYEFASRDIFEEYKNIDTTNLTEIQRAVRFLYLISNSFGSKMKYFGYGCTQRPKPAIFNAEILKEIKDRLRNTYVEHLDFQKIIDKYDRAESFFYFDPPYFEVEGYGNKFGLEEQLLLKNKLQNIKGKFLLTINDHPQVREWYKDFNIIKEVQVNYSMTNGKLARKKFNELLITNY